MVAPTRFSLAAAAYLVASTSAAVGITGPLLQAVNADPSIIMADEHVYSVSTNHCANDEDPSTGCVQVPVVSALALRGDWIEKVGYDALAASGPWSRKGPDAQVGGPDVNQFSPNSFIMYYSAVPKDHGNDVGKLKHCIGAATAITVLGPYHPQQTPFICTLPGQPSGVGTGFLNANLITNKGINYVVYKNGSAFNRAHQSRIYLQRVAADWFTRGPHTPQELLVSDASESNNTEEPALVQNPSTGGFVLFFYNAGFFAKQNYRIKYATSDMITRPYRKQGDFLKMNFDPGYQGVPIVAPGGVDFLDPQNPTEMTFMTWKSQSGPSTRLLHAAKLVYSGVKVSLAT